MKVVLFCGGLGMRMRADNQSLPKPMMPIGSRPVLWHVMRYYAHFGHKDFILCLGYKSAVIKEYFLRYNEALSFIQGGLRDFSLSRARNVSLCAATFVSSAFPCLRQYFRFASAAATDNGCHP